MNNGQIFDLVNILIRKEKEGDTITPADFSKLLDMCSLEKGNADYSYFERSRVVTDSIRSLMKSVAVGLSSGVGDFIAEAPDYWHENTVTTSTAKLDILTSFQYDDYKYSDLLKPTTDYPVCKISGDDIYVLPISISTVDFNYLSVPNTPFYDYYIDVDDNYVYMPVGSSHLLVAGEEYRDGTTSGTVNSISVEMSYPNNERVQVVYLLLSKLGIALNDQDAVEYGLGKEQKEEAQ
jgi:hypothetical protein